MTLNGSTVTGNTAAGSLGTGGGIYNNQGSVTLSNGASVTVTIIVTPKKAGTLTNTVHVSSASDPNEANNTATEQTVVTR